MQRPRRHVSARRATTALDARLDQRPRFAARAAPDAQLAVHDVRAARAGVRQSFACRVHSDRHTANFFDKPGNNLRTIILIVDAAITVLCVLF